MITTELGHVIIVLIAIVCGMIMLKLTKKVIGITVTVGLVAIVTKYFGLW